MFMLMLKFVVVLSTKVDVQLLGLATGIPIYEKSLATSSNELNYFVFLISDSTLLLLTDIDIFCKQFIKSLTICLSEFALFQGRADTGFMFIHTFGFPILSTPIIWWQILM